MVDPVDDRPCPTEFRAPLADQPPPGPQTPRIVGCAAAVMLAVASWTPELVAVPVWLVGTVLLGGAFVLIGRRSDQVNGRWLAVSGLLWAVPLLASAPLGSRDAYAYACQGELVTHGLDPYQVGVANLPCQWLHSVPTLWWHTASPYGPLWLVLSGGAAAGSGGHLWLAVGLLRIVALAGIGLLGWAGLRLARALRIDPRPAGWLALASPLLLVHAVSGGHNDALMAGLVLAAFAVAARPPGRAQADGGAPAWALLVGGLLAGGLLGLAVAVKVTALVPAPFLVLLVARDRRWCAIARATLVTLVGMVAAFAAVALPSGYRLGFVGALRSTGVLVQWTSLPTGIGMTLGYLTRAAGRRSLAYPLLSGARTAGLVVLGICLVALWWWARRRADDARSTVLAAGLAMVAATVLAPIAYPWYALTVIALLAYGVATERVRYRLALATVALALLTLPDGTGVAALTKLPGALLDTTLVVWLIAAALTRRNDPAAPRAPAP